MDLYRVGLYDKRKKRMIFKTFSLKKFTHEEAIILGEKWKIDMQNEINDKPDEILEPEFKHSIEKDIEFKITADPKSKEGGISICLIGSTKSGKTIMIQYLYETYFKKNYINLLFTNSLQSDKYKELKKDAVCSDEYRADIIRDCYDINKGTKNKYSFNIIIDDVIDEKDDESMKKLLLIYRNSNISCIVAGQGGRIINRRGRANINYMCFFKLNTDAEKEDVIKEFLGSYMPRELRMIQKIQLYDRLTSDHHFIFLNTLENIIGRCKIKPVGEN